MKPQTDFTYADAIPKAHLHSFTLFPNLPVELRYQVWHHAMERQRIIKVFIFDRETMDDILEALGDERPETYKDEQYSVLADGYRTVSKLFHVTRESREAALAFYRVHLPCWLGQGATESGGIKPGILYFNPEHDYLFPDVDDGATSFMDFLHDLKTIHDRQHKGLLKLAMDCSGLNHFRRLCIKNLPKLNRPFRESLGDTIAQLHEVYFVHSQGHWHPFRNGSGAIETRFNLSIPVIPTVAVFNRLRGDPRPIVNGLAKVINELYPHRTIRAWKLLLHDIFGVCSMPHIEYRILLIFNPATPSDRYDRENVHEWLRNKEIYWLERLIRSREKSSELLGKDLVVQEGTAFGFGLFSFEDSLEGSLMDLSRHQRQLASSDLP